MQTLSEMQDDLRRGYLWGATGIVVSGLVWIAAGMVALRVDPHRAVWTLFIGAALIVPVANLLNRLLGVPGRHTPGNPLAVLALESTVLMLMALPLAYGLSRYRIEWFFPAVLMIIGGRYLVFATLYGTRIYWLLGALLGGAAYASVRFDVAPHASALLGGGIEVMVGSALLLAVRRRALARAA